MGRPQTPIGTYGKIAVSETGPPYKARARFRDSDGVVRPVARFGQTKTAATHALTAALRDRQKATTTGEISGDTDLATLADAWHAAGIAGELDRPWSSNTGETYGGIVDKQIKDHFGGIRIRELRLALINSHLTKIRKESGPSAAKTTKTVLTGMCAYAIRYEALDSNPVRDAMRIAHPAKDAVRALTVAEAADLCDALRCDELERVQRRDLPDLVEFMLATGARIGEVCAARDSAIDLEAGTWEINATVIRRKGIGLVIQPRPKTAAGWRVLALPPFAVEMVRRRIDTWPRFQGPDGVIFSSPRANELRDKSNTTTHLRETLDRLGYPWVTSHTFRKTVATRLDEAGLTARQIADQLGHAKPSMTQDVYMGRNVVSAEAARILDR